jgi:glycosyltransferase involved in cell wall biosynthesis
MSKPKVSTVLTTYDRPDEFKRSLHSAIEQTYHNMEIVIVDGGSECEYISEVISSYPDFDEIQIHRHARNRGISAARNTGIENATGELIAFLDDDDIWRPEKIEKQVSRMESEDRQICYTWMERVDENGNVTGGWWPTASGMIQQDALKTGFPAPSAFCMSKEALTEVGGFDESLTILEDPDLGFRLMNKYEYACVPEVLVKAAPSGEPSSERVQEKKQALEYLLEKHAPLPDSFGPEATELFKYKLYTSLGMTALKAEEYEIARDSYLNAIRAKPQISKELLYALVAFGGRPMHKLGLYLKQSYIEPKFG